jgi:membrane protein DedA with SNARE-associated domain
MDFFSSHELIQLLHTYGYAVLCIVVGLECLGLPVPGETLVIAASILAGTTHQMSIVLVVFFAAFGAIIGQMAGYWIGWRVGFRLLRRYGRYIGLTDRRLAFGRALFRRHGVKVIIASRFIVVLRTLAALLAGANHMPWPRFIAANIVGSVAWAALYGGSAYALGHEVKRLAGPVGIVVGVIAAVVVVAVVIYVRRAERQALHGPTRRARNTRNNSVVTP